MSSDLCVLQHRDGEREQSEPGWYVCMHHRKRMTTVVADVRDLWVDMAFVVEAGTTPKDDAPKTRHLKAAEAPAPANLEVLSLRDNRTKYGTIAPVARYEDSGDSSTPMPPVMEMIASWVMVVAEERPLARELLPGSTIAQLNLLLRHGDWIAAQPWVDDYLGELTDLRKTLAAAVRDHTHRRIGSCRLPLVAGEGLCGGALLQENGSDVIKCVTCGAAWVSPQEHARLAVSLESA